MKYSMTTANNILITRTFAARFRSGFECRIMQRCSGLLCGVDSVLLRPSPPFPRNFRKLEFSSDRILSLWRGLLRPTTMNSNSTSNFDARSYHCVKAIGPSVSLKRTSSWHTFFSNQNAEFYTHLKRSIQNKNYIDIIILYNLTTFTFIQRWIMLLMQNGLF